MKTLRLELTLSTTLRTRESFFPTGEKKRSQVREQFVTRLAHKDRILARSSPDDVLSCSVIQCLGILRRRRRNERSWLTRQLSGKSASLHRSAHNDALIAHRETIQCQ